MTVIIIPLQESSCPGWTVKEEVFTNINATVNETFLQCWRNGSLLECHEVVETSGTNGDVAAIVIGSVIGFMVIPLRYELPFAYAHYVHPASQVVVFAIRHAYIHRRRCGELNT